MRNKNRFIIICITVITAMAVMMGCTAEKTESDESQLADAVVQDSAELESDEPVTESAAEEPEEETEEVPEEIPVTITDSEETEAQEDAVEDTTAPTITGADETLIVKKDGTVSYKKGVTATDDIDEEPTLEIDSSNVDTSVLGDYQVIYTATDAAGNSTSVTRTVTVESSELDNVTEQEVYDAADAILAEIITDGMTDEEKLKACFQWCYYNISYIESGYETNWVKAAYKGMVLKQGDCTANWASMKVMLNRLGIQNMDIEKTYIKGKTGAHHKWNLVNLGDGWYHVDSMKNMWNVPIFMWTTEQLMEHSNAHNNTHGFDPSLYPTIQ